MSGKTGIQWTAADDGTPGATWNPVVGCTYESTGCLNCYARVLHDRRYLAWKRGCWPTAPAQYHQPFKRVQLLPDRLSDPLRWRTPRRVFVNSMSDLFHEAVPDEFIAEVFGIMAMTPRHTYQVLTKRPERMRAWVSSQTHEHCAAWATDYLSELKPRTLRRAVESIGAGWPWPLPNVWLGVSVEDQAAADERIPHLLHTSAAVRFLSCEPLIGPVSLHRWMGCDCNPRNALDGEAHDPWCLTNPRSTEPHLHWVIVGGESGSHARPMHLDWARRLARQCHAAGVAVFVKQLGSRWAKQAGAKDRHGGDMEDWPDDGLRIRQFPQAGLDGSAA